MGATAGKAEAMSDVVEASGMSDDDDARGIASGSRGVVTMNGESTPDRGVVGNEMIGEEPSDSILGED